MAALLIKYLSYAIDQILLINYWMCLCDTHYALLVFIGVWHQPLIAMKCSEKIRPQKKKL